MADVVGIFKEGEATGILKLVEFQWMQGDMKTELKDLYHKALKELNYDADYWTDFFFH